MLKSFVFKEEQITLKLLVPLTHLKLYIDKEMAYSQTI